MPRPKSYSLFWLVGILAVVVASVPAAGATVTVKETAGVGATAWPTTVVIPLPEGQFQNTSGFNLSSNAGAVPAQFEVVERWANKDGSIRHVAVHFQSTVSASGSEDYTLATSGVNPSPADAVGVAMDTPSVGQIQVTTGPLRFTVNKTSFNLLDTVWYDTNNDRSYASSERIVLPSGSNGARFDGCKNVGSGSCTQEYQHDTGLTPDSVTVEESGPMRAVIKFERYTRYNGVNDHKHGYVVRLYAYAGKPWVKIDYQLINAATGPSLDQGKWASPLYFNALDLDFALNLSGTVTVRTSKVGGDVDTRTRDQNGVQLAYTLHDRYEIRRADDSGAYVSCNDTTGDSTNACDTAGFLDVSDGSWGVETIIRNMWETWPNGIEIDDSNRLQVQLWPNWSAMWRGNSLSSSGLYWLDDMRAVYKEVLLNFHGPTPPDSELTRTARTFDRYPVPVLPVDYYASTRVTLDLDGLNPLSSRIGSDTRLESNGAGDLNENGGSYRMGWDRWYAPNTDRLSNPCATGGGPKAGEQFIATESPQDYWNAERWMISELNGRPQWMGSDYRYSDDYGAIGLTQNPYCGGYWRAQSDLQSWRIGGTGKTNRARDDQHAWFYHMGAYWFNYNLWAKDWFTWQGEFRRTRYLALREDWAERAQGHAGWVAWQAYRVTGNTDIIDEMADYIGGALKNDQHPLCGRQNGNLESSSSLEKGFLTRTFASTLQSFKGYDWQRWADVFLYVSGYMEWDYHYGGYTYHPDDGGRGQCYDAFDGGMGSSGTAWNTPDAVSWYYWNTGKRRFQDQNRGYVDGALGSGPYDSVDLFSSNSWDGRYGSRVFWFADRTNRTDSSPPSKINDLEATRDGTTLSLSWTSPGDASYYLVVWSNKQLEECTSNCPDDPQSSDTNNYRNWWAAEPFACGAQSCSGQATIGGVSGDPVHVGVFSFDSSDNMSVMSNVAQAMDGTVANPPVAPQQLRAE